MTSVNDIVFSDISDKDKAYSSDYQSNVPLYACMVASQDPVVEYYAQRIQQGILQGEEAAGVGTAGNIGQKQIEELVRVMKGVYNATLATKMVYSETETNVKTFGDISTGIEHIRLPREVATGNTGLCIELALLHASVLKEMGEHPIILLQPGHAIPGVKFGNSYYAIESTGIGGAGLGSVMSADLAFQKGEKELQDFFVAMQQGKPGYYLLDIDELNNEGFSQMEMKDNSFLRQKIDQLAESFKGGNYIVDNGPQQTEQNVAFNNNPRTDRNNNTRTGMARHKGEISFEYPANWTRRDHPLSQLPILTTVYSSPGETQGAVEIYKIPGISSPVQAMQYVQQELAGMGMQIRYSNDGQQNGLARFTGISMGNGIVVHWESFLRLINGGVEAVVVGAGPNSNIGSLQQRIMNTIN